MKSLDSVQSLEFSEKKKRLKCVGWNHNNNYMIIRQRRLNKLANMKKTNKTKNIGDN